MPQISGFSTILSTKYIIDETMDKERHHIPSNVLVKEDEEDERVKAQDPRITTPLPFKESGGSWNEKGKQSLLKAVEELLGQTEEHLSPIIPWHTTDYMFPAVGCQAIHVEKLFWTEKRPSTATTSELLNPRVVFPCIPPPHINL